MGGDAKCMVKHPTVLGVSVVSSADVEKYSLLVKGILGGVATLLLAFGVVVPIGEISPLIDQFGTLIVQVSAIVSTVAIIWGGIRKLINGFKKK